MTGKGSDCRIAVNIVRVTIALGISSDVHSRPGSVLRKDLSVLSLNIYELSQNILSILLNGDQIPHPFLWVFSLLLFSLLLRNLFCRVYSVHGWVRFTNSLLKTNSVPQQMK